MNDDVPLAEPRQAAPIDPVEPLILDFLRWLAPQPRPYREVMDAWRTSCPRLTIWEDCLDRGYIERMGGGPGKARIVLTALGRRRLDGVDRVKR
jgi:hypothetical protein